MRREIKGNNSATAISECRQRKKHIKYGLCERVQCRTDSREIKVRSLAKL